MNFPRHPLAAGPRQVGAGVARQEVTLMHVPTRRGTLASLATAAVASFGLVALSPPAEADHNCITRDEFRRIEDGQRRVRVEHIILFQEPLRVQRSGSAIHYSYRACGPAAFDFISFRKKPDGARRVFDKERIFMT